MEMNVCARCGGMFQADVLESYCKVCLVELQSEIQAEHNESLLRERIQQEKIMAMRKAYDAFRNRLLDLQLEYLDDPAKAANKARVILSSGQCEAILSYGGEFRDALLAEISQDQWMLEAFRATRSREVQEEFVRQQIRSVIHWLQAKGEPGIFVVFEICKHPVYVQMVMTDERSMEFDFPVTIRQLPSATGNLMYERVSDLPNILGAKEDNLFDDEQLKCLLNILQNYNLSPNILRLASKDENGAFIGAMESLSFCIPVTETDIFEQLIPAVFSDVHGIDNCITLKIETGKN